MQSGPEARHRGGGPPGKGVAQASPLLASLESELHVTVKTGKPYDLWRVGELAPLATQGGLRLAKVLQFHASDFDGYEHRRTIGFNEHNNARSEDVDDGGARRSVTYIFSAHALKIQKYKYKGMNSLYTYRFQPFLTVTRARAESASLVVAQPLLDAGRADMARDDVGRWRRADATCRGLKVVLRATCTGCALVPPMITALSGANTDSSAPAVCFRPPCADQGLCARVRLSAVGFADCGACRNDDVARSVTVVAPAALRPSAASSPSLPSVLSSSISSK